MTPEQRYLFDLTGYLHLRNLMSEAELRPAQAAAARYIDMAPEDWPEGFGADLERSDLTPYNHGFAFDKSLERIIFHERVWPIVMELTGGSPRLGGGVLLCEDHRPGGAGERPVHL